MTIQIAIRLGRPLVLAIALSIVAGAGPVFPSEVAVAATPPPLTTSSGVVAADNAVASEVGAAVLRAGGNAVDAAAATAIALGVVDPASSGIGGGGFALIYLAKEKRVVALDFREMAPAALNPDLFKRDGKTTPRLAQVGGLAVGVPGLLAGAEQMVQRFGKLSWKRVVDPSIALAAGGASISWFLAHAIEASRDDLATNAALAAVFVPAGAVLGERAPFILPGHAATLRQVAKRGTKAFYQGPIAKSIVDAVAATGGVMTLADLAAYRVIEREPMWGTFAGKRIAAMPLPSSGGVAILQMLGILDRAPVALGSLGAGSSAAHHLLAEVMKHAFADRSRYLGDVNASRELIASILDPARLAALAKTISLNRTRAPILYGSRNLGEQRDHGGADRGTSHVCVIDADGNAVALTSTVNGYFGSFVMTSTGIVLNNQIDDFALEPGVANQFGLVQSEANIVGAGKRPLSSMSPTLVFDGERAIGCVGGAGGPRIITGVLQTLLNVLAFKMDVAAAVAAPRVHHQWLPKTLFVEPAIPGDVLEGLEARGPRQLVVRNTLGVVQSIWVDDDGVRSAASDPRKGGAPAAQ